MRMKSLILIFIALGCGLVAAVGISQVMSGGGSASTLETDQILVTLTDIDIGTKFDAQNVKLEDWPKNKIPDGAVRRFDDVKDKYAASRFYKGEPLHASRVSDMLNNPAVKVPPGFRAMPVKVEEDTVLKAIGPGDRVDVIVFLRRNPPEIMETGAFPILRNVRVFAVNTNTERAADAKGETTNFRTVSLLVKEAHAGELVVAAKMGNIFLTLRRPDEVDSAEGEEVTPIKEVLAGPNRLQSEPGSRGPAPSTPTTLDFVRNATAAPAGGRDPGARPEWSMVLMSPSDWKQFDWADAKGGLPTESRLSAAPPVSAEPLDKTSGSKPEGSDNDNPGTPPPDGHKTN
ncbi:MAG TPA: Flp pilus assembly protein CpaB [Pirellulaceae bacterium]|nr:Flp pilus assembly protein CpaB [Pirellulaceae bacterium]